MSLRLRFPLSPIPACAVASAIAACIAVAGWAMASETFDPIVLFAVTIAGAWPIAFALGLLAGAQLLPSLVGWRGYRWWTLTMTGLAAGVAPLLLGMLLAAMRSQAGEHFVLTAWIAPLEIGGLGGAVGGLCFWLIADDEGWSSRGPRK